MRKFVIILIFIIELGALYYESSATPFIHLICGVSLLFVIIMFIFSNKIFQKDDINQKHDVQKRR